MDRKEKVTFSLSGKDLEAVEKNAAVCGFPLSKYCKTIAIRGYIPEVDLPLESEVEKQPEYLTMQGMNGEINRLAGRINVLYMAITNAQDPLTHLSMLQSKEIHDFVVEIEQSRNVLKRHHIYCGG